MILNRIVGWAFFVSGIMANTRKQTDWEKVEKLYRAGQLSVREIARQHSISDGAIRKKAKSLGWERDLTDKVREKVRNELVRTKVRTDDPITEKEIVEQAASIGVSVVHGHQKRIGKAQALTDLLIDQLESAITSRSKIEDDIEDETREDSTTQRRNAMLKAIALPTHAQALQSIANSMKTFVGLERQAFNIDDNDSGDSPVEEFLNEISKRNKGLVSVNEN